MSRFRSGEALVFGVATLLMLVHALDDAFVHRGPGLGLGQHALAAGSFEDWKRLRGTELGTVPGWVMFKTIEVLSGDPPGAPLEDAIARVESPTLLISAGESEEREFNVLYDEAARGPVEHWNLPDATHTDAIREFPRQYEQRVVSLFDEALL